MDHLRTLLLGRPGASRGVGGGEGGPPAAGLFASQPISQEHSRAKTTATRWGGRRMRVSLSRFREFPLLVGPGLPGGAAFCTRLGQVFKPHPNDARSRMQAVGTRLLQLADSASEPIGWGGPQPIGIDERNQ